MALALAQGGLGPLEGFFGLLALDGVADGAGGLAALSLALDSVILDAVAHCVEADDLILDAGQHNDGQVRGRFARAVKGVAASGVREGQIQQEHVELLMAEAFDGFRQPLGVSEAEGAQAALIQRLDQQTGVRRAVLRPAESLRAPRA